MTLAEAHTEVVASGGICAPVDPIFDSFGRLVDRPAWVEHPVVLRDAHREQRRLDEIGADIDRCRKGERPVYKRLPPQPIKLPVFTAPRGGIRFVPPQRSAA